ncbi:MAG TPA: VCBS repeat-containing protein [Puia sp.]|nr:VCBS repeat-containing protein [Puia sp.]
MIANLRTAILLLSILVTFQDCRHRIPDPENPLFVTLGQDRTGLDFRNSLHPTQSFNLFDYMYFYNGSGIGAGDFNGDGKIDLFFAANQSNNKLYLNTGDLHFKDVTREARIPEDSGWSTGVSVVDINNDGLLDIYVCRVGSLQGLPPARNQLLVCKGIDSNGVPTYQDEAKEYGLDFSGFSTQAVFFDYDGDGDLDMYLLNHSIHQNGTFGPRQQKLATFNPHSGDRLYRNEGNNTFTDVTNEAGIHSSVIGYGLGITVADIDLDGYPDIYVGNDFHENDYLYINQHNGTFKDELEDRIMHTSQFSMGVDVADVNNDGLPEIMSMDMLPYDPYILKRSLGEDTWDIFHMKIDYGYNYQYTRNNLQFNRGNGHFSEIGLYSGVAATDWSWSPLWIDFDNDGRKDLFISNGIPKRLNDIDYINFVSNRELQEKMRDSRLDQNDLDMVNKFPEIKLPSKFFRNAGDLTFHDLKDSIAGSRPTYSNGAVYADLDGDGDLDIVVNNIDDDAFVYRNTANDTHTEAWLDLRLHGPAKNINALGAKAILFTGNEVRTYEKYPVRGFLSSMETPIHIGLQHTRIDSLLLVWPDNTFERLVPKPGEHTLTLTYRQGLPHFDYAILTKRSKNPTPAASDVTQSSGLIYRHKEDDFREFDREPLIPHMLSTEGPAVAVGDINGDGLDDVYLGASKWEKRAVFLQQPHGKFIKLPQPALDRDSVYEDIDACWTDVNGDGKMDLVVASGGNEYYGQDTTLTPRVYLGDGKGSLTKDEQAFTNLYVNASTITPFDFDGDGKMDLFVGGRSTPFDYGKPPRSYLLKNDGTGKFTDVTDTYARGLSSIGFVTHSCLADLDGDGTQDLILCLEWGGIIAFLDHQGHLVEHVISDRKGWWNFILPVDLDHDGHLDLIAGNLGLNSRLKATDHEPVRLYYYDFDGNGKKEQILTYYLNGKELPFANKMELEKQLPGLRKKFLYAEDFAKASLDDMFSLENLQKADTLTANYFANAVLMNHGNLNFTLEPLPWKAQLTSYRDAAVIDANQDSLPDILLGGNYYENNIEMGRYDADYGTVLVNQGHGHFAAYCLNGLVVKGQVRHIRPITVGGRRDYLYVRNNDSARLIHFSP